ncbi:hypothetical protein DOTSEDRAFT_180544 [Dothistroma septosporum NZE10]|uniref:CHCH domain-containing protein n=1 Tax=Dothistroma septosporum (strain NZE10 / CBS 128990) TaxID=675120 RepID=M2WI62_DOTSN|nr:hypothetical protein DOTSEDRAFT_180544 [Dothistroma septosporum NZE10]
MPRQSRGPAPRAPPSRPVAAPQRPSAPAQPAQARQASTVSRPQAQQQAQAPPQQASGGSGLFGQMASTAAGVAVGSSIGHAVGGWFGGGSSAPAQAEAAPMQQADNSQYGAAQMNSAPAVCGNEVQGFKRCMDENQGNLTICGWYMDQLKACQQAATQY